MSFTGSPRDVWSRWREAAQRLSAWILCAALLPCVVLAQPVSDEYRLKAAFLFRFPQFVEWPPEALDGHSTLDLCLIGPHPFGRLLDDLVRGEQLGGRPFSVREVTAATIAGCQLLYLPNDLSTRKAVLESVGATPILTVSDAPKFLDEGGIVQLMLVENRVRFEIDATAAQRAGLRLSAQLLRLAVQVRGEPS
jgi:hypothetical protein